MSEDHDEVYSKKAFREKLKEKYSEYLYISKSLGRSSEVLCFRNMSDRIIRTMKNNPQSKSNILAAAKIITNDIREMEFSFEEYPSHEYIINEEDGNKWVPASLREFMKLIIPNKKVKSMSLSQCLVQAARPRVIAPPFFL